jgi:hypothetical protein
MNTSVLTRDDPKQFLQAFNKLAATKGSVIDDVKQESYFETLGDLPIEAVAEAAQDLQREAGSFLPDAGTWYRMADDIACARLDAESKQTVQELTGAVDQESEELERTRQARDSFVRQYEATVKRTLPPTHPWKQKEILLPTYSCLECRDTGWVNRPGTIQDFRQAGETVLRAERCSCFLTNPVLEARRSHVTALKARRRAP